VTAISEPLVVLPDDWSEAVNDDAMNRWVASSAVLG
jgi:hypothetical protein